MSLDSFFDSLDPESQFEGWKTSINQKLTHLKNIIPTENRDELDYVGDTMNIIKNLELNKSSYTVYDKATITKRLKICNSLHKKFGI